FSQPQADFVLPVESCAHQNFIINNTSSDAIGFEWEFCSIDFLERPAFNNIIAESAGNLTSIKIVKDNNSYIGFATSSTDDLFKLNFGESIENAPSVTNLGDLGILQSPQGIDIVKVDDKWVGFIGHQLITGGFITRVIWNDINATPTAESIGNLGVSGRNRDVKILKQGQNNIPMFLHNNGDEIVRVNFGNSLLNDIGLASISSTGTLFSVSAPIGFDVIEVNGEFKAIISSAFSKSISVFDFGGDLLSTPTLIKSSTFPSLGILLKTKVVKAADEYFIFQSVQSGNVQIIELNSFNAVEPLELVSTVQPLVNNHYGVEVIEGENKINLISGLTNVHRTTFVPNCLVSKIYSGETEPDIRFDMPGTYKITLTAFDIDGQFKETTKEVIVNTNTAPPISYTSQNICLSSPIQFTSESTSSGLTYSWDFGDATTSTDENPSHTYTSAGEYEVTVEVSDGTCENFTRQTITVYEEPVPNFSMPGSLICSNQTLSITNTTAGDFGGNESWEWQVDGSTVSTDRDLDFTFLDGGIKEVKLIASIPGCSVEYFENINVEEGPVPSFSADNSCLGTLLEFDNTSTGQIDTYLWDFDNGFTSDLENPSFEYTEPGTYNVSLTVENAVGCITTFENTLEIFALPEVQFNNDLSCEQNITQFNDLSTVQGANIQQWLWDFGDPDSGNNTSSDRDPTHTFSRSGAFEVKLVTTSFFGCRDSLSQIVNVLASPQADFTFEGACIGEPVQFQDTSIPVEGESITTYEWDIAGDFSNQQNPVATLGGSGDYEVTLFTTSENLCLGSVTKTISISQNPIFNLGIDDNCENQSVKFYDLTETNGDAISSRTWNFDNMGSSVDSVAFFQFDQSGTFDVGLNVLTENGCEFSFQEQIIVNEAPEAQFDVSTFFGAPPLTVNFENGSNNAVSFLWNFDGVSESVDLSPSFVYSNLGEFNAQLVAYSQQNCTDTISQQILVLIPELEVQVNSLIIPDNNDSPTFIGITNTGTLSINQLTAFIDLGGEIELQEQIAIQLEPGQSLNYPLELTIRNRNIDYICVELFTELEGISESDRSDNSICEAFVQDALIVSNPFPNPTRSSLKLDVVSTESKTIEMRITDLSGAQIKQFQLQIDSGFETINLNVSDLNQGIYFLQIPELNRTQKFSITR
ncbi:MAG: PKD domain-containing protein, partial [Bacteroidota bacterium]